MLQFGFLVVISCIFSMWVFRKNRNRKPDIRGIWNRNRNFENRDGFLITAYTYCALFIIYCHLIKNWIWGPNPNFLMSYLANSRGADFGLFLDFFWIFSGFFQIFLGFFFPNFDFCPKTHLFCFLFNEIWKNAMNWIWVSVVDNTC